MSSSASVDKLIEKLASNLPIVQAQQELGISIPESEKDILEDYKFTRDQLKTLISQSNESVTALLNLALSCETPQAFVALATVLKNSADMTIQLMEIQTKKKALDIIGKSGIHQNYSQSPIQQQNNVFIGSTTQLQRKLISDLASKNVSDTSKVIDVTPAVVVETT